MRAVCLREILLSASVPVDCRSGNPVLFMNIEEKYLIGALRACDACVWMSLLSV